MCICLLETLPPEALGKQLVLSCRVHRWPCQAYHNAQHLVRHVACEVERLHQIFPVKATKVRWYRVMVIFYLVLLLRHFIIEQLVLNEQNKTFGKAKI